ncbi:uncharacterized protein LOC106093230 [Stomoxys calcitrans]|uniref:MADF domain-containing protein n=1 Tax=Stomoxys calcitrans TaxID=35570 RepID=A0A1I8PV17_STOCA|nr:uncharacterized protein LOC106093230 [Stomoxys calcitrans]
MDSGRKLKKYLSDSNPRDLIREVKRRPGLYDKSKLDQPKREHKQQLWTEVAESLTVPDEWDNFTVDEKEAKVDEVQHKWKHLRNHFLREVKLIRTGQAHTKRKYIYYNDLEFLNPFVGMKFSGRGKQSTKSGDSMDEDEYDTDQDNSVNKEDEADEKSHSFEEIQVDNERRKSPRRAVKVAPRKIPQHFSSTPKELTREQIINKFDGLKKVSERIRRPPSTPTVTQVKNPIPSISMRDGDISFCLSLVPTMRKLEESKRLKAKIEILTILHKYVETEDIPKVKRRQPESYRNNDDEKSKDMFEVNFSNNIKPEDSDGSDRNTKNVWWT